MSWVGKKGILGKIRYSNPRMAMEVHIEVDLKEMCYGCWNQWFELAEDCVLWWVFSGVAFDLQVLV